MTVGDEPKIPIFVSRGLGYIGHPPVAVCMNSGTVSDVVAVLVGRCYHDWEYKGYIRNPGPHRYSFWHAMLEALDILSEDYQWHTLPAEDRLRIMDNLAENAAYRGR